MFVVDTNVLVYAFDANSPDHADCRAALVRWRAQNARWHLTWGICSEFLSVVTNRRILRTPLRAEDAWLSLSGVLRSPGLEMLAPTDRYAGCVADVLRETPALHGNQMHDVEIAALMRDHGIRTIYTRDADFHRFRFLEVIDPAARNYGGLHER